MHKKIVLVFLLAFTFMVVACKNFVASENSDGCQKENYGSLAVFTQTETRMLNIEGISYAVVTISGMDISGGLCSEFISVKNGGASGIIISKIPAGKTRIVSVQGYDSSKNAILGAIIRGVADINPGSNSVMVTQATTTLGNVFNSLLSDGENLSSVNKLAIENVIDASRSWSLINTAQIALDYKTDPTLSGKKKSDYYIEPASVNVISNLGDSCSIKIFDPASKEKTLSDDETVVNIAEGTWSFQIFDGNSVVANGTLTAVRGKSTCLKINKGLPAPDISSKLIIFVKNEAKIWAWENKGFPMSEGLGESWETQSNAVAATKDVMADPAGWFMKDFSSIKSRMTGKEIYFKLNKSDPELHSGCTGTFWYDGTNFLAADPSESSDGEIKISVENPASGDDVVPLLDKIFVHAQYRYAYLWENGNSTLEKVHVEMNPESGSWYAYEIPCASSKLIFKPNAGNDWGGKTADLSRTAGEWWYLKGKWYESNPEDSVAPNLVAFSSDKNGIVSGKVDFSVQATDNMGLSRAEIALSDGKKIGELELSGKAFNGIFSWNTSFVQNSEYTVNCIVFDTAGNRSESKSLSFSTQNKNLPPVAVVSGAARASVGSEKKYSAKESYDKNGGTISSYVWSVSGATIVSGDGTDTVKVKMPSDEGTAVTISVTVTDNDGEFSAPAVKNVTVLKNVSSDFRDESIYFLMTTRFYDGDASNNRYCWDEGGEYLKFSDGDCGWRGDFKGLAEKLDYIKALGFSAVWITPVVENSSGIDYHGYHAYDFSRVDPRYESKNFSYQDLIDACHEKGIKVIQDIVLNHTGNFGERNLFKMFEKESSPYINPDIPTPSSISRSPFMKVAADGNAYSKLMAGLSMKGASDYDSSTGAVQYGARINAMKEDSIDTEKIYHHTKVIDWNSENCQLGQMAGDCVDLNTENPIVFNYLKNCYVSYINMGVDAFRIDTVKHISRLAFNEEFIPAFMQAGGDDFYIFGETCARYRGRWNEGVPALSPAFYTWKEDSSFGWSSTDADSNSSAASAHFSAYKSDFSHPAWADGIANHLLKGNNYHAPDYSMRSHLDQIDFPMHWAFSSAQDAFSTAVCTNDPDFNDATWNVTYVDSHDYAPDNAPEGQRFNGSWPDKLNLMFTFRGIPCIYYGSEIEFKKGMPIDPANTRTSLEQSGRAYFGTHLEGNVVAMDYGEFTASGTVADTLNHELSQHIIRLNKIRRAIPALRKGQYSTENCSGSIAFKRRYTDSEVDSFALVTINGDATFSGLPGGTYIDVVTGDTKSITEGGAIAISGCGGNNMRVYVNTSLRGCDITGKIGKDGFYLK